MADDLMMTVDRTRVADLDDVETDLARRVVAAHSVDAEDCALLLDALGLEY